MLVSRTEVKDVSLNELKVGDIISFELADGEPCKAMAVKEDQDGMTFVHVNCLNEEVAMNDRACDYDNSHLRDYLLEGVLDNYPKELKELMIPVYKDDLLTIPSEKEIFGVNKYGDNEEGEQWEPMKSKKNRMALIVDSGEECTEWYWLRTKVKRSAARFAFVYYAGSCHYNNASYSLGVRPAFKIRLNP